MKQCPNCSEDLDDDSLTEAVCGTCGERFDKADLSEAATCANCGEEFDESELEDGVCEVCTEEKKGAKTGSDREEGEDKD